MLPKGLQGVLYRSFYYVPASAFVISRSGETSVIAGCLLTYALVEGLVCTSRNVLNDLKDYREDELRGHRWRRFVSRSNFQAVLLLLILKLALSVSLAFLFRVELGWITVGLLGLQLLYDHVTKPHSPVLSAITVALGYALRAASVFTVAGLEKFSLDVAACACLAFLYALYQTFEWRLYESLYIKAQGLRQKAGTEFFAAGRIAVAVRLLQMGFAVAASLYGCLHITWDYTPGLALVVVVTTCTLQCLVMTREQLLKMARYGQSGAALLLFAVIFPHPLIRAACVPLILGFALAYHSRINIESWASEILRGTQNNRAGVA